MSRSCVCGGNLENCRYCNGLGSISDALADALTTHAQRIEAGRVRQGFLPRSVPTVPTCRPQEALVRCTVPGCSAKLNPKKAKKHMQKMHSAIRPLHSPEPSTPKRPPVKLQQPLPPKVVPCPIRGCSAKLSSNRIARHLYKAHRSELQARVNQTASSSSNGKGDIATFVRHIDVNSIPDGTPKVSSFGQTPEKNLDATKGYAHAYRESGRFGSHPSHDGFDGESGPD